MLVANLHLAADLLDASGPSSRQEHRAEQLKTCEEVLHDRSGILHLQIEPPNRSKKNTVETYFLYHYSSWFFRIATFDDTGGYFKMIIR